MKTLDEIGIFHQTDKASQFTRTYAQPHNYLRHMEPFFEPMRDQKIEFLEIGIGGGESAKTWLEYFSEAHVVGVDINANTNPYNTPGAPTHFRYTFLQGDQGDGAFWKGFIEEQGKNWNVIVDDGSHYAGHIITTFDALWPYVVPGGVYIIEDLLTSYGGPPFTTPGQPTQMDFITAMLDSINRQERQIERIHFSRELCIIQKSHV